MIFELLAEGEENARTARELATVLQCHTRDITAMIEAERREGAPICASCRSDRPGYYLAANAEELETYCKKLKSRAIEIFKTRQALVNVLRKLAQDQEGRHVKECVYPTRGSCKGCEHSRDPALYDGGCKLHIKSGGA